MLYHETNKTQTKINELKIMLCYKCELIRPSKSIINLAVLRTMFRCLFEKTEFTANAKSSMQVYPCTTAMQKFHTSYMHAQQFFLPPFDMSAQHKCQQLF